MYIRHVTCENFRCFKHLPCPIHPRLTVFVAENGDGKTAILDAISYALSRILTRMPGVSGKNLLRQDIRVLEKTIQAPFCSIELATTDDIIWSRSLKRDATEQTAAELPSGVGDKQLYEYLDPLIHTIAQGQEAILPVFAYYGAQRAVLDIPQRIRNFKKNFTPFDGLANTLEPSTHFKDLFEWFYAQEREYLEHIESMVDELTESGEGGRTARQIIDSETVREFMQKPTGRLIHCIRRAISAVVPGYNGPRIKSNPLRMVMTRERPNGVEEELSLQMLSDGYRTMLAMVMDFARRMAETNPHMQDPLAAEAIMLIDEVDLHLHPSWQQRVICDLMRAFPRTQLIVTTHSPQVISTVPKESIRIIRRGEISEAPPGTDGAEVQRILKTVFMVRPRPNTETARELDEYLRLVNERKWDSPRALELRQKLDEWSQGQEPRLVEADLQIENMKWEAGH